MHTLTYTIEFNPQTGTNRPWELYVESELMDREFCSSCETLEGAEKSRKRYVAPRAKFFKIVTPAYQAQ